MARVLLPSQSGGSREWTQADLKALREYLAQGVGLVATANALGREPAEIEKMAGKFPPPLRLPKGRGPKGENSRS
jgi:hypothetical protein